MNLLKADSLPCEHEAPALWASVRPLWSSPKFVYWGKVVTLQCSLVFPLKHIKAVLVIKRTYFLTFSRTKRDTSADVLTSAHFLCFFRAGAEGEIQYGRAILTACGGELLLQTGPVHQMYAEV